MENRYYKRTDKEIIVEQGDIFSNIEMEEYKRGQQEVENNKIIWNKVLVASQSCDLHREQENKDNFYEILSVLVIPIFRLTDFQSGTHLLGIGKEKEEVSKRGLERIALENRYQILRLTDDEKLRLKMEDSILDYRYYFTVPINKLKRENYEFSLVSIYADKITQSFTNYISRIPLPIELDKAND